MRPHLDAATTAISLGLMAFGGMAAAPAVVEAQVGVQGGSEVAFSMGEIAVVGGMMTFIVGGLVAVFKLLLQANAAALAQKDAAHAEAIRLKDETIRIVSERNDQVAGQLADATAHNNAQTDQLIVLLTGVVKNNETSLKDMTGAIKEMTSVMTSTAARDSEEHLAVLKAIETLAEARAAEHQQDLEDRASERQERNDVRDRLAERGR